MKVFDAHFHIIDPQFPLQENHGYLPPNYLVKDYLKDIQGLGIVGGALVSGSFQGFDQSYLLAALQTLGQGFVGVTQLPVTTPDEDIVALHAAGVRAVRFNLFRGGSESLHALERFAKRVYDMVGWHVELYMDSRNIPILLTVLKKLPLCSVDHLGLEKEGIPHLLSLVELGNKVKASGFTRVNFDVSSTLKAIYSINPKALMFGTDLPSTRALRKFDRQDLELLENNFTEDALEKILYRNALECYKL